MTITRTAIIAGNWKMNYGPRQAVTFAEEIVPELGKLTQSYPHIMSILCPPAISLAAVHEVLQDPHHFPRLELGAQNMYFEEKGAFTGEISPSMVHELCTTVILGHSERRGYFGETDELVNRKALAALHHHLRPIICIGENLDQYEAGQTEQVIYHQVQHSLANFPTGQANVGADLSRPSPIYRPEDVVIAYEPIWAIGTGKAATVDGAGKVIHRIRTLYGRMYGEEAASAIRILYGGSVTSNNISEFVAHPDIDGALVGGASIKGDFVEIVRKTIETMQR